VKESLNIKIDFEAKENLRTLAEDENRSLANMVETLIVRAWREWRGSSVAEKEARRSAPKPERKEKG
jgi:predicted transcriptional regulator